LFINVFCRYNNVDLFIIPHWLSFSAHQVSQNSEDAASKM